MPSVQAALHDWLHSENVLSLLAAAMVMSDRWITPKWIRKMFQTYHDPCPIDYKIDAFSYDWCEDYGQVYVNPPYSNPKPWVEKAIKEISIYPDSTIVMLLKHDSSTQWYRLLHEAGAMFLPIQGRLDFTNPEGEGIKGSCSSTSSVLVVLSEKFKVEHFPGSASLKEWIE